jgi:hypothetical protein
VYNKNIDLVSVDVTVLGMPTSTILHNYFALHNIDMKPGYLFSGPCRLVYHSHLELVNLVQV